MIRVLRTRWRQAGWRNWLPAGGFPLFRSLYSRIMATFLIVVVISIGLSYWLTSALFQQQSRGSMMQEIDSTFGIIEQLHEVSDPASLESFLKEVAGAHHISIAAVNQERDFITAGQNADMLQARLAEAPELPAVLSGSVARVAVRGEAVEGSFPPPPAIGRLVSLGSESWAMFVLPERFPANSNFVWTAVTLLLTLLAIGSILIVIAARYLVRPIKQLNEAAVSMAAGNFAIRLAAHRRDELGKLAESMNAMALSLSRLETMRQDFVANVSHELQSPLTSINGFAEALRSDDVTAHDRDRYVGIIQQESSRLSKLCENLLKLSSLDSQHHPYYPAAFRLDKQLRRLVLACEPAWQSKAISIELVLEPLTVKGDEDLLSGVWSNLLTNSIKFTPASGEIRVTLAQRGDTAVVEVADSGVGVAEVDRERIFERFYKADPSRNRNAGGSGLGLSIARKIVELHGGTIRLDDSPPDAPGAKFTVALPMG
ncbi:sensor histidine kinase [Paenibacillus soyae]|uniref:Heme sensor protein HssS n=1 Tax=Paenibacillus soyae TaxID=2969249 RepID=A0A9X2MUY1_9BACL|nr:HAMP domain-containing sensor histidine kinase [Paenibacillus soyae]MCR2806777.1 HAMP domain-containing histidine kinase [Paenibacillus soyae]